MTYRMKTINIHRLLGAMLLAGIMLAGCTKDNTLEEIQQTATGQETPADEFAQTLESIDKVYNVEVKTSSSGDKVYYFDFRQNIDHKHPDHGTFNQRVAVSVKGLDRDVVLYTHGYTMSSAENFEIHPLSELLNANQVNVEHRYFGQSLPEAADSPAFTYFNAEQQAYDLHAIVQTLKQHVFKSGKWASTGTSKDGITSALYAYYSDQNGWNDIAVYVPFCAPFLTGSTVNGQHSCMDPAVGYYMDEVCGTGYPAGSEEAQACQRLHDIPRYICSDKVLRDACRKHMLKMSPSDYRKIVEQYNQHSDMSTGDLEKDLTALTCDMYYAFLFDKFSYVQFTAWAKLVPDPVKATTDGEERQHLLTFITMDKYAVNDSLKVLSGGKQPLEAPRRSQLTDAYEKYWNYIKTLRQNPTAPYYVQSYMELGVAGWGYKHLDGTYLTEEQARKVNHLFTTEAKFEGILRQDGGRLMRDFRQWVATESTQNIVFVYAYNDPWTGGRPDDTAISQNPKTMMVIDPIAVHGHYFLDKELYTPATKQAIADAVNKWM